MSPSRLPRRPRLALPFTVVPGPDRVRLIAGEDFRYTLGGAGLEAWLPQWLPLLDGSRTVDAALEALPSERRAVARQILERLAGERVLVDGPVEAAHAPVRLPLHVEGDLDLGDRGGAGADAVAVLGQDRLDYDAALRWNARRLTGSTPWFWVSCGPLSRGYVSPAFLPDAGPCLACLLTHFRRLSPAPELYDDLAGHAQSGGTLAPAPFPPPALAILGELLRWKVELLGRAEAPAALYRLHVLETATLEVTAHRVFLDPQCAACRGRR